MDFTDRELENLHNILLMLPDFAPFDNWHETEKEDYGNILKKVESELRRCKYEDSM